MKYNVFFLSDAEEDLYEIFNYKAKNDSVIKADKLLNNIEEVCKSLSNLPNKGHIPPELECISILDYKEIHHLPYRIIYQIINNNVYIHCILDGRRDIQEILLHRLLR
ncbi:unnamed protein product [marine sediment metagenome]|uniref:Plasmid stabilization system protein n=1 Tax=marine sediment metagenome TaxID=412755 RepID=X1A775_9ZZZZ